VILVYTPTFAGPIESPFRGIQPPFVLRRSGAMPEHWPRSARSILKGSLDALDLISDSGNRTPAEKAKTHLDHALRRRCVWPDSEKLAYRPARVLWIRGLSGRIKYLRATVSGEEIRV
jgi:hypothetical protein